MITSSHRKLQRLHARWRVWRNVGEDLNRRASVEAQLFSMASGKSPLPDADKCRELALKLGVPDAYRSTQPEPMPVTHEQLAITAHKLFIGSGPGEDMWCELDDQALQYSMGLRVGQQCQFCDDPYGPDQTGECEKCGAEVHANCLDASVDHGSLCPYCYESLDMEDTA
ncbi:hypothetical protein J2T57_002645 [Natronocella acetinitrilica]|uniref:Uncharacterized protein n=1 Tax=Natronocella acetinitrilica TaxID=414046 RepID=A0AAE3G472_9GAMM|nr:PHD finger domain-containing protein [Natronocella acetinitrilica]MCP1675495.1 hypothetical protein [Natronocella acetinitrilica]